MLVVGAAEPEIQSWLRAAGHLPRAVRRASAAGDALEAEEVDLVIVDRDAAGLDAPEVCRTLREDERLGDAWLLAITVAAKGRMADSVLNAGADDYLHRPFTRAELIARTRAGLRAAQERSNDRLLRTLMENVPGAIYRCAWHADYQLEMITDEIERISGYPPANFLVSSRRTILSLDPSRRRRHGARVRRAGQRRQRGAVRARVPDRPRRRRRPLGARPRATRQGRRQPIVDGRRDVRHHRAPRRRGGR